MKLPTPPPCPLCGSKIVFVGEADKKNHVAWSCSDKAVCGAEGTFNLTSESP